MESSENQETGPDAANSTEESDNAPLDQTSTDSQSAQDASTAADEASGMETVQATSAGASNPWYPVVGATEPVTSAIEPVSGSEIPVSSSDAPEATPIPALAPEPLEPPASAAAGPVWPTETQAPASADVETVSPAETAGDAAPEVVAPVAALAEIDAAETPAAEAPIAEVGAPDDDAEGVETPAVIEAGAAEVVAAEAAIPAEADVSEADAFAASSGVWPEPPTPWVDTGAIAAVGAAVGAFDTPPVVTPNEMSASDASATPDVSDLPTAINAPQAQTPQVDAPPPPPEEPPAYTPPPPVYIAPPQPVAGAYVAPQARPQNTTPVIIEAILAFFGIYGVGWLISGETSIGVALLIAGFVWDAIFVVAAFTVIGLCCVVPLQLIFVALSAFQLNNRLRMRA